MTMTDGILKNRAISDISRCRDSCQLAAELVEIMWRLVLQSPPGFTRRVSCPRRRGPHERAQDSGAGEVLTSRAVQASTAEMSKATLASATANITYQQ